MTDAAWTVEKGKLICRVEPVAAPDLPHYEPPKWKKAPDHRWLDELLADVAEYERRLREGWRDGGQRKDICIR